MFNALRAENSPFSEQQIQQLQAGFEGLDTAQSAWLSGFIAGRLVAQETPLPANRPGVRTEPAAGGGILNVFFASQTGNGETIARQLGDAAQAAGLGVNVQSLADLRPAQLKKLEYAAFVISTHGEGDPPDDAVDLFEYLAGPRAARLDGLRFRVLALGDRSYSKFCESGRQLENLLLARGASTFADRVECDIDVQPAAGEWSAEVVRFGLEQLAPEGSASPATAPAHSNRLSIVPQATAWSRARPFAATVERVQKITGLGSEKDVYHVELSLEGSGLQYEPGDSLGVWARNSHELVGEVLDELRIAPDQEVVLDGHRHSIGELLIRHRELTRLSPDTVEGYARAAGRTELEGRYGALDAEGQRAFIERRQFIDLLREYPLPANTRIGAEELAGMLRPLAPRSYSIASSRASVDEEVHLTVATLFSDAIGEPRRGVASDFLNHRLEPGDEVGVFLEPNRRFRLPEDEQAPIILIGAGTGVAPYRAFMQELEARGDAPDSWLIFGNPHLRTDFLYQREWLEWRRRGLLKRIDVAFSRDQAEKHYVQHIVRDEADRIARWLDRGARIYVCGCLAMGRDVEEALRDVLAGRHGMDAEQAAEELSALRRQGRLLKDLY